MNEKYLNAYIKRLENRLTFLKNLTKDSEEEELGREKAEIVALSWAISYIKETKMLALEHQIKWFSELGDKKWSNTP